jgi:hypothetical protein
LWLRTYLLSYRTFSANCSITHNAFIFQTANWSRSHMMVWYYSHRSSIRSSNHWLQYVNDLDRWGRGRCRWSGYGQDRMEALCFHLGSILVHWKKIYRYCSAFL